MIVGDGLIANAFSKNGINNNSICILASGVSNSTSENNDEFAREKKIILENLRINKDKRIIYFGTCSVNDPEKINSKYVQHKIEMEEIISKSEKYLIIRLPQIAGNSNNKNTILNYIYSKIKNKEEFDLWINAKRNIIDIIDVVKITSCIINESSANNIINVANQKNNSIMEIVEKFEKILNTKANYKKIESGSEYIIDTQYINKIILKLNIKFDDDYIDRTIIKYYK